MPTASRARTLVLVNPRSANGETGKRWPRIARLLHDRLGGFDEALTRAPGDATQRVREALRGGYRRIVSVGGDGTHNEVVNGFFDERVRTPIRPEAMLAIVSSGTGGDFRRSLAQPRDLPEAVAHVGSGHRLRIDVGRIECLARDGGTVRRAFLNIASFGLSGRVDEAVNRSTKALGGFASFLIGTTRTLATYRPQTVRLRVDDGDWSEERILCVAVANGRYFGGGMEIAPLARVEDGCLDVVRVGALDLRGLAGFAARIYRGAHLELDGVELERASCVEAESDEEVLIDLDGEMPGRLPARIEILPACLDLEVRY